MNWLLAVLLAVAAFWLASEGFAFFAFLLLAVLIIFIITGMSRTPEQIAVEEGRGGVFVSSQGADIPSNLDFKIKPNWEDNTLFEDMFASWGEMMDTVGRSAKRFALGRTKYKK